MTNSHTLALGVLEEFFKKYFAIYIRKRNEPQARKNFDFRAVT
jgi:hypothetical protein